MNRRFMLTLLGLALAGVACYQDDILHPPPISPTKVLLTDSPFPFDSVASVDIYVTRVEATAHFDTLGPGNWVELAAPHKRFNLLTLQQGTTAIIGEGVIDAGHYQAIRMTINVDSSWIRFENNTLADVLWNVGGYSEIQLNILVEEPLAVDANGGSEIVIDFDVGRSFPYNLFGTKEFSFIPWVRAVNSAATGAIAGTVTRGDVGGSVPVQNANVTVYSAEAFSPIVLATGHTDAAGHYKVAFLRAGEYSVVFEQPDIPALGQNMVPVVPVTVGSVTPLSVALPPAGGGGAYLNVTGPATVGVGGRVVLHAAACDPGCGSKPSISWLSRDTTIAQLVDSSYGDTLQFVLGRAEGTTWIVAQAGALWDSLQLQVIAQTPQNPVATVTVTPSSRTIAVGDSTFFSAELRDSTGAVLTNRAISWFLGDSLAVVDLLVTVGPTAVIKGKHQGSTVLWATSEGKAGSATITIP